MRLRKHASHSPNPQPLLGELSRADQLLDEGWLYWQRKETDQAFSSYRAALAEYDRALTLAGKDAYTLNNKAHALRMYGAAHAEIGEFPEARQHYTAALSLIERALALDPKFHDAHSNLGLVHWSQAHLEESLGEYGGARRDYEAACAAF